MNRLLLFCVFSSFLLTSCFKDDCTSTRNFFRYDPVIMHINDIRADHIEVSSSIPLKNPGKLYFYKNYLLINELGEGIHFYNIADSNDPRQVVFYHIPGNFDMAINDDVLYVDNAMDMISINIQDIHNPTLTYRVENYHETHIPEDGNVVAYMAKVDQTTVVDCSDPNFFNPVFSDNATLFSNVDFGGAIRPNAGRAESAAGGSGGSGVGGSFARFTISKDYLYTVNEYNLNAWNIQRDAIEKTNTKNLGWGIETIYPFGDYLFIGSNNGMFIYNNENPSNPVFQSEFAHAAACDPVVSDGEYAYVTLRDGNQCQGFTNQMDVVNVANIRSPSLVREYQMDNPHGLSLIDKYVIVGEGRYGIKLMDKSDPANVKELYHDKEIKTYDVIALALDKILVVGDDGFYIMKIDKNRLEVISEIQVQS